MWHVTRSIYPFNVCWIKYLVRNHRADSHLGSSFTNACLWHHRNVGGQVRTFSFNQSQLNVLPSLGPEHWLPLEQTQTLSWSETCDSSTVPPSALATHFHVLELCSTHLKKLKDSKQNSAGWIAPSEVSIKVEQCPSVSVNLPQVSSSPGHPSGPCGHVSGVIDLLPWLED